jgi:hypothetical protein
LPARKFVQHFGVLPKENLLRDAGLPDPSLRRERPERLQQGGLTRQRTLCAGEQGFASQDRRN